MVNLGQYISLQDSMKLIIVKITLIIYGINNNELTMNIKLNSISYMKGKYYYQTTTLLIFSLYCVI
jgi:hypothetical protein